MSTLEIIAPVFAVMALGFGAGKTKFFPPEAVSALMRFVWYVAIPAIMFRSIAKATFPGTDELMLVAGYYLSLFSLYFLVVVIARIIKLPLHERALMALSACLGNGWLVGIPVIEGVYGGEGLLLMLIIITFHVMTLVPLTTILIESSKAEGTRPMDIMKKTANGLAHNPLLIALFASLTISFLAIPIPSVADRFLNLLAVTAAPCGLFAAGATLSNIKVAGNLSQSLIVVFLKTMALPAMTFLSTKYLFDLPALWVGVATLMAGLPISIIAFSVAEQYDAAPRRAATSVLLTTLTSMGTLSILIYLLTKTL